jgi:hypothetical protein
MKYLEKEFVVIYVTKDQREIHRDWNPFYIPTSTNLVSFKNVDTVNMSKDLKETLFFVGRTEYQVPNVLVVTLLSPTD